MVIHQGTNFGLNPMGNAAGAPWVGPILDIANALQDTTVDAMIVGHTHRVSNLMVGDILVTEGINAGATYSVLQLMVKGGDVDWAGGATRLAKDIGVAQRADVKAIVDAANTRRADPEQGHRHRQPTSRHQARPDPALRVGDGQPGRGRHAGARHPAPRTRRYTNSGGLRQDLLHAAVAPASRTARSPRASCSPSCRSATTRRRDPHRRADADGLPERLHARLRSELRRRHRPVPADLGPQGPVPLQRDDTRRRHDLEDAERDPAGPATVVGDADTIRFVTNDFMYTGGDGYTVFTQGTNVMHPGDPLLHVVVDYMEAHRRSHR